MKQGLIFLLVLHFMQPTLAQLSSPDSDRSARVTLRREAVAGAGTLDVELFPREAWQGDIFVSLYKGEFRERRGLRRNDDGDYRLDVRLPEAGEWGIYLRYGVAQAGYAGYGRLRVPPPRGTATTTVELASGFSGDVRGYVQPLGFAVFGLIAALALIGLRILLLQIRRAQTARS